MDTMARREDDGGRGYDDGTVAGASAMVGNGKGDALGTNERVQGLRCVTWRSSRRRGGGQVKQGSREVAWRAPVLAAEHLLASLARQSSCVERLLGWAGQLGHQVGRQVSSLSLPSFLFSFCFVFFCNCVDLIKMLEHFYKS